MLIVFFLLVFACPTDALSFLVVTGAWTGDAISGVDLIITNPTNILLTNSQFGNVIVNGTIDRAVITTKSCRISNISIFSPMQLSMLLLEDTVVGFELGTNVSSVSGWVYATPTTAILFSSPVMESEVNLKNVSVYASHRGMHFNSLVRRTKVLLYDSLIDVACRNESTGTVLARCGRVFGFSCDYKFDVASVLSLNSTKVRSFSELGDSTGVYILRLTGGSNMTFDNSDVVARGNSSWCKNDGLSSSVPTLYAIRIFVAEFGSNAIVRTGTKVTAATGAGCIAYAIYVATLSDSAVLSVENNTVVIGESFRTNTTYPTAAVFVGGVSKSAKIKVIETQSIFCQGSTKCASIEIGGVVNAFLEMKKNINVSSTVDCVRATGGGVGTRSVFLWDTNTFFSCSKILRETSGQYLGPFTVPYSYFVGRCNKLGTVDLLPATLPSMIPRHMDAVTCTKCHLALDCNYVATSAAFGAVPDCQCFCSKEFILSPEANRRFIDGKCNYISTTWTETATETVTMTDVGSSSLTLPQTRTFTASSTKTIWKHSSTKTKTLNIPTASHMQTPSRSGTHSLPKTQSIIPPPSAKELLALALERRMPLALAIASNLASVLAGFFSPTLANKATTISRSVNAVDCFLDEGKLTPIFYLDAFDVGKSKVKRLTGGSIVAMLIVMVTFIAVHVVHRTARKIDLLVKLVGHTFAWCLSLFGPWATQYALTTLVWAEDTRFVSVVCLLVSLFLLLLPLWYVLFVFPHRKKRPKKREKEDEGILSLPSSATRPLPGTLRSEKDSQEKKKKRGDDRSSDGEDSDNHVRQGDSAHSERETEKKKKGDPASDAEQDTEEDREEDMRFVESQKKRQELGRLVQDPKKAKNYAIEKRRQLRRSKRIRHWNVWHSLKFTVSLFPLYFEARDYRYKAVRLYFFEDVLFASFVAASFGTQPSADRCRNVTLANFLCSVAHLGYLIVFRPFRRAGPMALVLLMAAGLCALSACTFFATQNPKLIDVSVQIAVVLTAVLVGHIGIAAFMALYYWALSQRLKLQRGHNINHNKDSGLQEEEDSDAEERRLRELSQKEQLKALLEPPTANPILLKGGQQINRTEDHQASDTESPESSEADSDAGIREKHRRRWRKQFPQYPKRPLLSPSEQAKRFVASLKYAAGPPAHSGIYPPDPYFGNPSFPKPSGDEDKNTWLTAENLHQQKRMMIGNKVGFMHKPFGDHLSGVEMTPLVLLDQHEERRKGPRPKRVDEEFRDGDPFTDPAYMGLVARPFPSSSSSSSSADEKQKEDETSKKVTDKEKQKEAARKAKAKKEKEARKKKEREAWRKLEEKRIEKLREDLEKQKQAAFVVPKRVRYQAVIDKPNGKSQLLDDDL